MKKKFILLLFSFLLVVPISTFSAAYAADAKSAAISIPISTGLTGSDNSAKVFNLDLPSGVSSSAIRAGTLKYNGTNSVIGSIGIENGKIKLTLKGEQTTETLTNVQGFAKDFGTPYSTTPGNSIWLYSDGRRWQINDYKAATNSMDSYDLNADDGKVPSEDPPLREITTQSIIGTDGLAWYNNSAKVKIPDDSIIQSSVRALEFSNTDYKRTPNIEAVSFKNGRIIIDYMIPKTSNGKKSFNTIWKTEQDDGKHDLSGDAEGRRYQVTGYYYYLANAKVTSYSYAGNVTFDYALPDGPSLSGYVTVLMPKPNPTKFANTDVDVQLSIKGQLANYTDATNISEWVFYAKKKGSSTAATQKDYQKVLTSTSKPFNFTISKTDIASAAGNYQQPYDLTVTVRFTKPVVTKSGTITEITEKLGSTIEVYKNTPSIEIDPIPPSTKGKPPVASIFAPPIVKAGDEFQANGSGSYDPDGVIVGYYFESEGGNFVGYTPTGAQATLWYPNTELGQQTIKLTVSDKDMLTDSAGTFVEVIEPIPVADLDVGGTLKENRKVILTSTSSSPKHYPLVDAKTKITIAAVPGGGGSDSAIKYSGSLTGVTNKDVLFKQPGLYKATIAVENTLGYKDTNEITFEIVPDDAPVMYISMPGKVYRDPQNGNKAVVNIDDLSYSPDGDIITQRLWDYRFDSDNDGSFADESWVSFSTANEHNLNLVLSHVGKYEIRHTAVESFGQETIDAFVTPADRRSGDTSNQNIDEKTVEVLNLAPEGDWAW